MNQELIENGAALILEGLGVDLNDHNFCTTPHRVFKVFQEIFSPPETDWPVFKEDYTDIVVMSGHRFWTFCPHHMLPVEIVAHIAYLPGGKVLGASKLVRIIQDVNRKPMTQEKLTDDIIERLVDLTGGIRDFGGSLRGAAVLLEGEHGCFRMRGAKTEAKMRTLKFYGEFDAPEMIARFMDLIGGR